MWPLASSAGLNDEQGGSEAPSPPLFPVRTIRRISAGHLPICRRSDQLAAAHAPLTQVQTSMSPPPLFLSPNPKTQQKNWQLKRVGPACPPVAVFSSLQPASVFWKDSRSCLMNRLASNPSMHQAASQRWHPRPASPLYSARTLPFSRPYPPKPPSRLGHVQPGCTQPASSSVLLALLARSLSRPTPSTNNSPNCRRLSWPSF